MSEGKNIQQLWQGVVEERPDDEFLKTPQRDASRYLTFQIASFFRRAVRVANAFRGELGLKEGDLVTLMTDDPADYALLMHGAWLAGVVAFPVDLEAELDSFSGILAELKTKAVIYPPAATGKIARLFSSVPQVEHWIVSGSGRAIGSDIGVKRLDDLLISASAAGDELPALTESDPEALVVLTRGTLGNQKAVALTQKQLCVAGAASASLYHPSETETDLMWSLLPMHSLDGVVQSIVVPLFNEMCALLDRVDDIRKFWDKCRADNITHAQLLQEQLRVINRMGKARSWLAPNDLRITLFSENILSSGLIESFETKFGHEVQTVYSITEGGGVICSMPPDSDEEYHDSWTFDFPIPSSGKALPGVEVKIVNADGQELDQQEVGRILVRSAQTMKSYRNAAASGASFEGEWLNTGDDGFIVEGEDGERHLFVLDRSEELIDRGGFKVNPAHLDNVLYEIKGVEFVKTIGFINVYTGLEVGAFVIPLRASNLTEEQILEKVRNQLAWEECPKVIVFGSRKEIEGLKLRKDFAPYFEKFLESSFLD